MQVHSGFSVHRFKHDGPQGQHGCTIIEDVKGFKTPVYRLKKKTGGSDTPRYKDIRSFTANVSVKKVLAAISRRSEIEIDVLIGPKRDKIIMPWRQLAYLLSYELTGCTLTQIGKVMKPGSHLPTPRYQTDQQTT